MSRPLKQREVIGVLGKTGQGKSVWSRSYLVNKKRVFIFDPVMDTPAEYLTNATEIADAVDTIHNKEREQFCFACANLDHLELLGSGAFLCGNNILFIEESAYCFQPRQRSPQWLRDIIFLGRHRSVSLMITAQRAVSIPIDLRSQFSRLISFSQHESSDVDWMRDYFGEQTWDIPDLSILECLDSHKGEINRYRLSISERNKGLQNSSG